MSKRLPTKLFSSKLFSLEYVEGVEGNSIYLNGYRIVGPKPWGGGPIIEKWEVSLEDIHTALKIPVVKPAKRKVRRGK